MSSSLASTIQQHYTAQYPHLTLGATLHQEQVLADAPIHIDAKSLNRHGLIAGATGTGKTKTIQMLCEQLSLAGVPSLVMDIKGDLSGLAAAGELNAKIEQRQQQLDMPYSPQAFTSEFLSLSDQPGVKLRATVSEFGPILFSKMLELNDTQSGVMAILFKFAQDQSLPLLDLADVKALINHVQNKGKKAIEASYGHLSKASLGSVLRKIIELESQAGDQFFCEPAFDVNDLLRCDEQGHGVISILRLLDLQDRPKLFSTFMLNLLATVYRLFPELGDPEKPKLMIFIDEAHLIFDQASKALLQKLETIVKLIRSKGVGLIFCTQTPNDVPDKILSQLGLKIQHALRAFTAKDRKAIKLASENFPVSEFYQTDQLLTSLGIGEALVTALDHKGRPTPLAAVMLRAPLSRMGPLTAEELQQQVAQSTLVNKYRKTLDRHSAEEILQQRLKQHPVESEADETPVQPEKDHAWVEKLSKNTLFRQIMRTITREVTRAVMALLGMKKK